MNQDLEEQEEKFKKRKAEEEKTRQKVSGRSVFELQKIIKGKSTGGQEKVEDAEDESAK